MQYFGNSTNVTAAVAKTVPRAIEVSSLINGQGSPSSWTSQQVSLLKRNTPKEDPSDPTPLLVDKIASLPPGSARRKSAENIKATLDGTASNVGDGMDSLTRESYKEVKRLTKQSSMIQQHVDQPLPSKENLFGSEENQTVSNLQDWKPAFINANRPISDAIGSHADTDHSVNKDPGGTAALVPLAATALVDKTSSSVINEAEGAFKSTQLSMMQHLPSKLAGSIRQLSTALDSILSVPFEIASDVYNGLMMLIDEISNLLDMVINKIMDFVMGALGGLLDSIFPMDLLDELLDPIMSAASEIGGLFSVLGGFPAVSNITNVLSSISGSLVSVLRSTTNLANLLASGSRAASIVGGLAGYPFECTAEQLGLDKLSKFASNITGALYATSIMGGVIGGLQGIGNLGSMIGGGISSMLGSLTKNIRDLPGLIGSLLPAGIGFILNNLLGRLCSLGMVGNGGYSIGHSMNSLRNNSFSRAMNVYACHNSIISPLFGKQHVNNSSYARESNVGLFENSPFVLGAQGHKGVTMIGPGGSVFQKPFGTTYTSFGRTYNTIGTAPDFISSNRRSAYIAPGMSYLQQATVLNNTVARKPNAADFLLNLSNPIARF